MMKKIIAIIALVAVLIVGFTMGTQNKKPDSDIRYVALGDSYTIGEGASEEESWPTLLTKHLQKDGVDIELIANPSVTGWTTQRVIDDELPIYESSRPTFATLLIGVNDWVQGVPPEDFRKNLIVILVRMQAALPDKSKLIVLTIPDFSVTPVGKQFSNGRDIAKGIAQYNQIIQEEANKRGLPVVDIYPLTQQMKGDQISSDGLHPSAKEYALWEKEVYPVAKKMVDKQ